MKPVKFLSVFPLASLFLIFITWQGITIFTLGYRLKEKEEELRSEEIHYQNLLKEYTSVAGLDEIDAQASKRLGMRVPAYEDIQVMRIDREKLYLSPSTGRFGLLSYLKEAFQISQLQSGQ